MIANIYKLLIAIILLELFSCSVYIPEKYLFIEAPYNYHNDSVSLQNSNVKLQAEYTPILNKVIKTETEEIGIVNNVSLSRNYVKSDSLGVEYFVFNPEKANKVGVFYLGGGHNIFDILGYVSELSSRTKSKIYVLHYRGYGKSEGKASFKTQFADNQQVITYLNNNIDFVIGYSIGSVFAIQLAVDNHINQLYLLSPISNSKDVLRHFKRQYTKGLKSLYRPFVKLTMDDYIMNISNIKQIQNYKGKLVILHGTNDETLPYYMGEKLFDKAVSENKKMYTMPNGVHSSAFKLENLNKLVIELNKN